MRYCSLALRLYGCTSVIITTNPTLIITTNPTFAEWSNVFINAKMTTAFWTGSHYCHIIETGNESFRCKQSTASAKIRIQQREKEKYSPEENQTNLERATTNLKHQQEENTNSVRSTISADAWFPARCSPLVIFQS